MRLKKYPKVLIISDASWRDDNNIGNTFNDIFKNWPKDKIAMVYGRPDLPMNNYCEKYYQISESRMIKRIFNKKIEVGQVVHNEVYKNDLKEDDFGAGMYSLFRKFRLNILLTVRELLWKTYKANDQKLYDFVENFNPDIVFNLATPGIYMNKIQNEIVNHLKCDSYLYFVDDLYTMKQFSISPVFWINRLFQRSILRTTVSLASKIFVISELMKIEYDKIFDINSIILTKMKYFDQKYKTENYTELLLNELNYTYTGNLIYGRFSNIVTLGKALEESNEKYGTQHTLNVYSGTKLTRRKLKKLESIKTINFHGSVSYEEVIKIQKKASILVHVESFNLKQIYVTRLSFSTKLVDYFQTGKCIFAIGKEMSASINYLSKYKAAVIANNRIEIFKKVDEIAQDSKIVLNSAKNSYNLGVLKHNLNDLKCNCDYLNESV